MDKGKIICLLLGKRENKLICGTKQVTTTWVVELDVNLLTPSHAFSIVFYLLPDIRGHYVKRVFWSFLDLIWSWVLSCEF